MNKKTFLKMIICYKADFSIKHGELRNYKTLILILLMNK